MQIVSNGPDIPERLLQAHEDGRVVFFCGAGISSPADLPGFSGLVDKLYLNLAPIPNAVQLAAIKAKQFDTAISLLEGDIIGGRERVRQKMADILKPKLTAANATATHDALLTLSKCRNGQTRLITTNFDRLFEEVINSKSLGIERFKAPLLPVPKSRWSGLVYLHGLLTDSPTANDLHRLVVSSGDFGLAYLTERWASRFISELLRNYTVCFVGYSINDPVLRYMMDALAADRLLGESPPEMFAFGSYSKGKKEDRANEWLAKNVTPILYREQNRHAYLHKTLRAWADIYRDGVHGKERIVSECAMARPLGGTQQDEFVGRLLWALSDPSGLPAKRFANLDPAPSLDWLQPLSDERFQHTDLGRFGVKATNTIDSKLRFSVTRRPTPYKNAPWMCIVEAATAATRWDVVMHQLAHWLTRHLDDPALFLWLVKHGGQLHPNFARIIGERLDHLAELEFSDKHEQLDRIRERSPNAIPRAPMRTLWRLMLSRRVIFWTRESSLFRWRIRLKHEGLTASLRQELREYLMPRVSVSQPLEWQQKLKEDDAQKSIKDLVAWELVLSASHVHSGLGDLSDDVHWSEALPVLQPDFTALLRDALDLMQELGGANAKSDHSYMHQPSISVHPQNRDFRDWTALINLTRDSWLATAHRSPELAVLTAESWWHTPYPLFRRLAFFAAAQPNLLAPGRALEWLLAEDRWWLWSVETQREAIRLLVTLAPKLQGAMLQELEVAVLAGPPREMFRADIEPDDWTRIVDQEVWLRLKKVTVAGAVWNAQGLARLAELSTLYPDWELAKEERDEFPYWIGDGSEWRKFEAAPRRRRELVEWLKKPKTDKWQEDDWRQRCRDNFSTTFCALFVLAKEGIWPTYRWREAFQAWSEETLAKRSWRYMAPVLATIPNDTLESLAEGIGWWLKTIANSFDREEELFFELTGKLLALENQHDVNKDNAVGHNINPHVGHATEALLRWWYRQSPKDDEGLPAEIKTTFTLLCDSRVEKYRDARALLATHLISLFRADPEWTTQRLLPLFNWYDSELEAIAVWEGFLYSPRLYRPLMEVLKEDFLATASHYEALSRCGSQYAALLTSAALDPGGTFTIAELRAATRSLPAVGLHVAAQALVNALEASGAQRIDYWNNRVDPYLHTIWPNTLHINSPEIAESLGRLCVAAQDEFPAAFDLLRAWLEPLPHPDYVINLLYQRQLSSKFPGQSLDFLRRVIGDQTQWPPSDLSACLDAIREAAPNLVGDQRFESLRVYVEQHQAG